MREIQYGRHFKRPEGEAACCWHWGQCLHPKVEQDPSPEDLDQFYRLVYEAEIASRLCALTERRMLRPRTDDLRLEEGDYRALVDYAMCQVRYRWVPGNAALITSGDGERVLRLATHHALCRFRQEAKREAERNRSTGRLLRLHGYRPVHLDGLPAEEREQKLDEGYDKLRRDRPGAAWNPTPEEVVLRGQSRWGREADAWHRSLPEDLSEVLRVCGLEEMPERKAAEALGITRTTLRRRRQRLREGLEGVLGEDDLGPEPVPA